MQQLLESLSDTLIELEGKFISNHDNPTEDPQDFILDVKSYCVLSHAAFEEFIENLCVKILNEVCENYRLTGRFSFSTLCLLHFTQADRLEDDKWPDDQTLYEYFLKKLKEIKQEKSKEILENNHGIGMKYLKKMLLPLGLKLPTNQNQVASLANLAKARGGFAHTAKRASKVITPDDALTYVYDVYGMCVDLCKQAKVIIYYK
jgi:hypothetical protein